AAATTAGHAGTVVDAIAPSAGDLSAESVAAVVAAAEQLEALVAEGVPAEPATALADLPERYVAAGDGLDDLRARVAAEVDRLERTAAEATRREGELAAAVAATSSAVGAAAQAAGPASEALLA